MDWINQLNRAINYMEEHMEEEIDLNEVGKIAACSSYHFQRMFAYMANVSLSEYIRRRKMSLAAVELMSGKSKVIDIALKYGYDSPTAFNRAFQKIHGIAPSKIKEEGVRIKAYPPIHFHITIKGESEMNYRIVKKEAFKIVGLSMPLEHDMEKNNEIVPQMWGKAAMDGTLPLLGSLMNTDIKGLLGVSVCGNEEDWKYFIAVATTMDTPAQLSEYQIPEMTWAVFYGEGTNITIQELEARIFSEWLPTSGYDYANAPDMEVYINPDPENAVFEVWIPVKSK